MSRLDQKNQQSDNGSDLPPIGVQAGQYLQIKKSDLKFFRTDLHTHAYKPDFTDETEDYCAMTCVIPGCMVGFLGRKDNEHFMKMLDEHRVSS